MLRHPARRLLASALAIALLGATPAAAQIGRGSGGAAATGQPSRALGSGGRPVWSGRPTTPEIRAPLSRPASATSSQTADARGPELVPVRAALGTRALGPIGAYGPLGSLGPLGRNAWNVTPWMQKAGDWRGLAEKLGRSGGPLSAWGPLGRNGPLGDAYKAVPRELRGGGAQAVLGPVGPLGALGPLGPLGPHGAHGFATDRNGNYVDRSGKVQREITVPYGNQTRTYELVEVYSAEQAMRMRDNDTSFLAEGRLKGFLGSPESHTFTFSSRQSQYVNVLVTPQAQLDRFRLEIRDTGGRLVAASDPRHPVPFLQLYVPKGTTLRATVDLQATGHALDSHAYRLSVVGGTRHTAEMDRTN